MPSKSTSSKSKSSEAEIPSENDVLADEVTPKPKGRKGITEAKQEALSLFEVEPKGKSPRARSAAATGLAPISRVAARKAAEAEAKAAQEAADALAASARGPSLDEMKDNALNLFDETERKAARRRTAKDKDESETTGEDAAAAAPAPNPFLAAIGQKKTKVAKPAPVEEALVETDEADSAEAAEEEISSDPKVIHIKPPIIVKDLAERMKLKPFQLIKDLMALDIFANPSSAVDPETAAKICEQHGFTFEREKREKGAGVHKVEEVVAPPPPPPEPVEEELKSRPPIVTIMGHVDHGKTSLLDYIRRARVAAGEAGGITQHIGAYAIQHNGHTITFLDTPGHAAFSAMRARGATVTDIVVLVIAADDGMMPTTHEALSHARAAGVKIVVAINKCDLPRADVNRVKAQLQQHDLSPEDWGGTTSCIEVSATKGTNVDSLLDTLLLEAELLELRANPKLPVRAIVIESRFDAAKGATATVIAENGTLRPGMPFICGPYWGKIKTLVDDAGQPLKLAGPALPVEIFGFSGLPQVGDHVLEMKSEKDAKRLSEERTDEQRLEKLKAPRRSRMEDLFSDIGDKMKTMRLILKCDVVGSTEAIVGALKEIKSEKVQLNFIHVAAGPISESDVLLASASDAVILGFNTKVEAKAVSVSKRENVQVKLYSIIYELIDQVKDAMLGLLDPETREKIVGHALIKQVFKVQRGYAAGCMVSDGRILRAAHARVMRDGQPVFDGKMSTLRRFTEDVNEVRNGLECGIRLGEFNDYEENDIIECYEIEKLKQSL
jgi:translation initiation factor IF-2